MFRLLTAVAAAEADLENVANRVTTEAMVGKQPVMQVKVTQFQIGKYGR